jgi:periplasmic protein TonB
MGVERQNVSEKTFGSLGGCLVEGDPEQRARERGVRRRALAISITLQGTALAALVLVPLFGKPERIVLANVARVPSYYHPSGPVHHDIPTVPSRPSTTFSFCLTCPLLPPRPHGPTTRADQPQPLGDPIVDGDPYPTPGCPGCIPTSDREGPSPPPPANSQPKRLKMTQLDPALLIHRVEPVYPPLPRQMGRGGRVELRAIVATDGSIQSLQVVSGDPLFIQSALDAVQQWRYRPTILNGKPVEIDTFITVTYSINR